MKLPTCKTHRHIHTYILTIRAMVVHSQHARSTNAAMVRTCRPEITQRALPTHNFFSIYIFLWLIFVIFVFPVFRVSRVARPDC